MGKRKLIADPQKQTGGRRNTGNKAIVHYRMEPDEGSAHLDIPMQRWFERIDMPQLEDMLALSTEKRWTEFLRVMHHPVTKDWSITRIAKRCGLTLPDLQKFWRDSRMQQAMIVTSNALPQVMADIASDAQNKPMSCPRCDGFGTIINSRYADPAYDPPDDDSPMLASYDGSTALNSKQLRLCVDCGGTGKVQTRGDSEARKMLLEVAGVTGKKAPVIMNQHNHFPGSVENFVDKWDKDDGDVIDAEVEDIPPSAAVE